MLSKINQQKFNAAKQISSLDDEGICAAVRAIRAVRPDFFESDETELIDWAVKIRDGKDVTIENILFVPSNVFGCGVVYVAR